MIKQYHDDKMSNKKKVYTSIRIDPELWKEAKIEAIRRGMKLGELIEEAIRDLIKNKQ
jgi:predicted HicB family RNase H-like nuclease